jgi:hypothetical protein
MTHKLITTLERDIRNQVVIDRMRHLGRAARLHVFLRRYRVPLFFLAAATVWTASWIVAIIRVNS